MLYAMYVYEDNGDVYDVAACKEHLEYGCTYEVENVDMGTFNTSIKLVGIECYFNSVNFIFFKMKDNGELIEHDIFSDLDYNPYL